MLLIERKREDEMVGVRRRKGGKKRWKGRKEETRLEDCPMT